MKKNREDLQDTLDSWYFFIDSLQAEILQVETDRERNKLRRMARKAYRQIDKLEKKIAKLDYDEDRSEEDKSYR